MTLVQQLITIALCALVTMSTRFLPFLLFGGRRRLPRAVLYLAGALPGAIFGMLLVYCLRNVDLAGGSHGLPEAIAIALVAASYLWKKKMLVSIALGTLAYMLLVQKVF